MGMVIVGGGLAGAKAAEELRERGYDGPVTLVGAEPHLPYERPPLSKEALLGDQELDEATVHDAAWYADHDVDVRLSDPVTGIDLEQRVVTTGAGDVAYDELLLATGSEPRHVAAFDDSGARIAYLRTRDDSAALREALLAKPRVVIVGGGWIGLEVAAAARTHGAAVTLVEPQAQPLLGVMGPTVAGMFADLHREHDVDLRLGVSVESMEPDRVLLSEGDPVPADLVVVAIGAAPRVALAEAAGLDTDNGVLVDARLRTSDPHVWAAGDIAHHDHPRLGQRVRVEHWDNAIEQGKVAARNMLGEGVDYDRAPYFFTDQYDLGMEYVGHASGDQLDSLVVRGDVAGRKAVFLWHDDGRVLAGMHVNEWDAGDPLRALVGRQLDRGRLEDPSVPLDDLLS
ncbi:NAD(P)/FAD-dependent oxidoreductase [Nocardioides sp. GXQ0305]|uniref:NAD(P)/FAD-dependent oxidoreductase n=1 Tax=Nocardioides sp. GXQ0305 TaxID=3423912 RepID=UPI003D7D4073